MVIVREIGTPGPPNEAIGGVPTIHYLDFLSRGRGQVVRLFCEDAEIAFKDHRWTPEDFMATDVSKYNPTRSLPAVEVDGQLLTQSIPILRLWSAKLGKYDGKTLEERYFVDLISDITADWRTNFVDSLFTTTPEGVVSNSNKEAFETHKSFFISKFVNGIESHLSKYPFSQNGPFVLGSEVTYADFQIWQIYHDEKAFGTPIDEIFAKTPRLKQLLEAVEARPNVSAYLASNRYLG